MLVTGLLGMKGQPSTIKVALTLKLSKLSTVFGPRFCKRRGTLFKSLLSWLAVEVLSPCQKYKQGYLRQNTSPFTNPWYFDSA